MKRSKDDIISSIYEKKDVLKTASIKGIIIINKEGNINNHIQTFKIRCIIF